MANYRSRTKKEYGDAPPVIIEPKDSTVDSVGGMKKHGISYVQIRGGRLGAIDVWIREDVLQRVP